MLLITVALSPACSKAICMPLRNKIKNGSDETSHCSENEFVRNDLCLRRKKKCRRYYSEKLELMIRNSEVSEIFIHLHELYRFLAVLMKSSFLIFSFTIFDSNVVGLIFKISAAPLIPRMRPFVFLSAEIIYSRSVSI